MYFGGSGISWPVPRSLMKPTISFSTSQFSRDSRTFSHEASSLTQTVEAIFAKLHRLLFIKSSLSSSRSWNLSAAAFQSLFHRPVVSSRAFTAFSYSVLEVARLI
jgi:hypothetical protein